MSETKAGSFAHALWLAALLTSLPMPSAAQQAARDYPSKPIRLVVPFAAGGGVDLIAHLLAQKLAPSFGRNLFVDNRGGAGGAIGTDTVAKSAPDGYTVLLSTSTHASLPSISKTLPYDAVRDFAPITLVAQGTGHVLVVHPSVPARSIKEFIALAKARPGKLNYGSGGMGSATHFATESFNQIAGTPITHVPYKSAGQALIDLLAGRIDANFVAATVVLEHIKSGRLRPLGITAPTRWSGLPSVPTIAEAGVTGYTYVAWYGLWFPARTPGEYVTRMRSEVVKVIEDPATTRTFNEQGLIGIASTPQELEKTVQDDIELNRKLVFRMGLNLQ